jgi:hypothetical protein
MLKKSIVGSNSKEGILPVEDVIMAGIVVDVVVDGVAEEEVAAVISHKGVNKMGSFLFIEKFSYY